MQRACFNGYALWTYLTTPFLMTLPGFTVAEINPIEDNGERWFGLQAHFPDRFASHSQLQEFYFDSDSCCAATTTVSRSRAGSLLYVYDMVEADGIKLRSGAEPSCDANGRLIVDEIMLSIDVSDIHMT